MIITAIASPQTIPSATCALLLRPSPRRLHRPLPTRCRLNALYRGTLSWTSLWHRGRLTTWLLLLVPTRLSLSLPRTSLCVSISLHLSTAWSLVPNFSLSLSFGCLESTKSTSANRGIHINLGISDARRLSRLFSEAATQQLAA